MNSSKRPPLIRSGLLGLLFGGVSYFLVHRAFQPPAVNPPAGHPASRRAEEKRPEPVTRDRLLSQRDQPADLMAALDSVIGTSLADDREIKEAYIHALDSLSPQDLATLLEKWPAMSEHMVKHLARQTDATRLAAVVDALRKHSDTEPQKQIARNLLQSVVQRADYFKPDLFKESFALLNEADRQAIASGLNQKLWMGPAPQEKLAMIDAYLQIITDPLILDSLVGERTHDMSVAEAESWLLNVDPAFGNRGDIALVRKALDQGGPSAATSYINKLVDLGQNDRATEATATLVAEYSARQPREALEWVVSMPGGARNSHMVGTAFAALYQQDPAQARQIIATLDPALRNYCEKWVNPAAAGDLKASSEH